MPALTSVAVAATVVVLVVAIAFFLFGALAPRVSETWAEELGATVEVGSDSSGPDRTGAGTA